VPFLQDHSPISFNYVPTYQPKRQTTNKADAMTCLQETAWLKKCPKYFCGQKLVCFSQRYNSHFGKLVFPFKCLGFFLMILESLNWPWVYYPSSPRLLLLHLTPVGPPPNTGQAFKLLVWKSVLKKLGFQINVWGRFLDIISQDPGVSKSNSMVTCLHLSIWP
jgi:hypothetical protein